MTDNTEPVSFAQGDSESLKNDEIESSSSLTFHPPLYIQRYLSVTNILDEEWSRKSVRKVVDFGCADFKLFKYIKGLNHIEHICGIDIDETLMGRCRYEARPLSFFHILGYPHKLTVDLFAGSIAEPDKRLLDADAVICIELIEHLYPDVLKKVPSTVFEFIQPKLAIFTTPNADFNVLFNLKKFRHDDHKFEWSRKEFKNWCFHIISNYPSYEVEFRGIGEGPEGSEHLGCCSQMAIFRKISDEETLQNMEVGEPYKLYETFEYPYKPDNRSTEEKFLNELTYRLNRIFIAKMFTSEDDDLKFEIPVDYLWEFLKEFYPEMETFINILEKKNYAIIKRNDEYILEIMQEEQNSDTDDSSCENLESLTLNQSFSQNTTEEVFEEKWDCC